MNREELLKNAKQILFNTEMVQAILEGKKSVTRRIIKQGNILPTGDWLGEIKEGGEWCTNPRKDVLWTGFRSKYGADAYYMCRYQVGDILYVRETWCRADDGYYYKAGFKDTEGLMKAYGYKWHPSIHMPKAAARIFLKVTDVRIERLQDITETQVRKEGFRDNFDLETDTMYPSGYYFVQTWNSTIKKQDVDKYSWEANPWVWVIEFERVEGENE